ncbi:MAG: hypothetical protein BMS9Abin05_2172 [Rhodothermia bacterium]|nr:MAG: hypothetical protein BMS9Abin05_2172 [Rhodothermia bacterium]
MPVFPEWSSDSQTVYYRAFDDSNRSSFWSIDVNGGTPELLVVLDDPDIPSTRAEFATDGNRFYFTVGKQESDILVLDLVAL